MESIIDSQIPNYTNGKGKTMTLATKLLTEGGFAKAFNMAGECRVLNDYI